MPVESVAIHLLENFHKLRAIATVTENKCKKGLWRGEKISYFLKYGYIFLALKPFLISISSSSSLTF